MRCSICMIGLAGNGRTVAPVCGHIFHASCLITWFKTKSGSLISPEATEEQVEDRLNGPCPICNRRMFLKYCTTVYVEESQETSQYEEHLKGKLRSTRTRLTKIERKLRNERKAHRKCQQKNRQLKRLLEAVTSHCSQQLKNKALRSTPLQPYRQKKKLRSRAIAKSSKGSVIKKLETV